MGSRSGRHGTQQTERPEAIRPGHVSRVPQGRHEHQGWLRRSEVQTNIRASEDQAGGLVWRAKDANNYYIARANALEDNVTIYHTINGRRTEKKRASMKVASNQWHTLRVDFQANHFTVSFDGQKALEWDDDTFKDAGRSVSGPRRTA